MSEELERIRSYRADEPAASAAAVESARADLKDAIGQARVSRRRRPAHPVRAARPIRTARPIRPARPIRAVALGIAASVAIVLAFALGTGSDAPTSAVAAVLQRLADAAGRQSPVVAPHAGQYLYVDSVNANESDAYGNGLTCTALVPEHRQIWIAADGAGRLLETTGQASFPSPGDRATCERMHAMTPPGTSDNWFAPGCLTIGLASRLPKGNFDDPATLLAEMRMIDGGPPGPGEDFVHVGDFLRESDASPALRAAIYRAAATIPGVKLLGPTRDHLGRTGVGIGYTAHGSISELILDQRTGALLGEQTIDAASGKVLDWSAYRTSRIVDGIAGQAPGRLAPPCVNGGGYDHSAGNGVDITTGAPLGR